MTKRNVAIVLALLCAITYRSFHKHSSSSIEVSEREGQPLSLKSPSEALPESQRAARRSGEQSGTEIQRSPSSVASTDTPEYCGTDEKCLKRQKHHAVVRSALGGDAIGAAAYDLLTIKACAKIQACANGGKAFFATAIARLDPATMAQERLILQKLMISSSLTKDDKNSLLSDLLGDPQFAKIPPTSQQTSANSVHASQDAEYLAATQTQLIMSGADSQTVISSSLAAITNTKDSFAKGIMIANLLKRYPGQKDQILSAISK